MAGETTRGGQVSIGCLRKKTENARLTSNGCSVLSVQIGVNLVKQVKRCRVASLNGKYYGDKKVVR